MEFITNFINGEGFWQFTMLSNSLSKWTISALIFIASLIVLKIFKAVVVANLKKLSKKTKTELDDIVINAINAIHWPFYVLSSIYVAINFIDTSDKIQKIAFYIFLVAVIYYAIKFFEKLIDFGAKKIIESKEDKEDVGVIKLLSSVAKLTIWGGAIILVLSNMGYNVSSLIAGLGIGGLAVALALQNILSDLFSSVSIYFDKPFKIGDFVALGTQTGTVKKIGIKTTRIQTPQGEELVVANSELTKAQVRNFGVMERRRNVFSIGVTYDTKLDKLKKITEIIKVIIEEQEDTEVDRIHFKAFGDFSLNFEIVYYFESSEYKLHMDVQEKINFRILEEFEKQGIEMAFPTQTIHVQK